jgi:hypothetical protein
MLMIVVEGVVTNYRGGGGSGCCATRLIQRFNPTSHIAISTSARREHASRRQHTKVHVQRPKWTDEI